MSTSVQTVQLPCGPAGRVCCAGTVGSLCKCAPCVALQWNRPRRCRRRAARWPPAAETRFGALRVRGARHVCPRVCCTTVAAVVVSAHVLQRVSARGDGRPPTPKQDIRVRHALEPTPCGRIVGQPMPSQHSLKVVLGAVQALELASRHVHETPTPLMVISLAPV